MYRSEVRYDIYIYPFIFKGFLVLGINAYIFYVFSCMKILHGNAVFRESCHSGRDALWRCEEFALASYYLQSLLKEK
jgi:hypothetical protein